MTAGAMLPGAFFVMENGHARAMDQAAFLERAQNAQYILIGEGHPIRCDHEAQATVMRWLANARPSGPAVALEMVGREQQDDLDSFNRGEINSADLREALDWEHTWGHDFFAYGPVFTEAARQRTPLYAANLPPGAARAFGRGGVQAVDPAHRRYLPETIIPAGEAQREDLREVFERHAAMMQARAEQDGKDESTGAQNGTDAVPGAKSESQQPHVDAEQAAPREKSTAEDGGEAEGPPDFDAAAMFERFITVQSLWDTVMAENAVRVRDLEGAPVVVLAGSGHVDYGWGIALRLAQLDPDAEVLTVVPWRSDPATEPPAEDVGDVYFYCPLPPGTRMMAGPKPEVEADPAPAGATGDAPDASAPSDSEGAR